VHKEKNSSLQDEGSLHKRTQARTCARLVILSRPSLPFALDPVQFQDMACRTIGIASIILPPRTLDEQAIGHRASSNNIAA